MLACKPEKYQWTLICGEPQLRSSKPLAPGNIVLDLAPSPRVTGVTSITSVAGRCHSAMADNSTSPDAALLALFLDLAANISASLAAASADGPASTQNVLALSALVIAVVALLATTLQVVLDYGLSSPARQKCSPAAIHISSRKVHRHWSLRSWKWEYTYPDIDFNVGRLLNVLDEQDSLFARESFLFSKVVAMQSSRATDLQWAMRVFDSHSRGDGRDSDKQIRCEYPRPMCLVFSSQVAVPVLPGLEPVHR